MIFFSVLSVIFAVTQASPQFGIITPEPTQPVLASSVWTIIDSIANNTAELRTFRNQVLKFPELQQVMSNEAQSYGGEMIADKIAVFAPLNAAFESLPQAIRLALLQQRQSNQDEQARMIQQRPQDRARNIDYGNSTRAIEQGLLSYHVANELVDLSTASAPQNNNRTVSTLLYPMRATVWTSGEQQLQNVLSAVQRSRINQAASAVQGQSTSIAIDQYVNDARVAMGFEAENGFLYLIDGVMTPLWYLNITATNAV